MSYHSIYYYLERPIRPRLGPIRDFIYLFWLGSVSYWVWVPDPRTVLLSISALKKIRIVINWNENGRITSNNCSNIYQKIDRSFKVPKDYLVTKQHLFKLWWDWDSRVDAKIRVGIGATIHSKSGCLLNFKKQKKDALPFIKKWIL